MTEHEIRAALAAHQRGGGRIENDDLPLVVQLQHDVQRAYRVSPQTARVILQSLTARGGWDRALAQRPDCAEPIEYTTENNEPPKPWTLAIERRKQTGGKR